jgi:hypothetical protein
MAVMGQSETPHHVSDRGGFRRKRPWCPPLHEHTTTISGRAANDTGQHERQRRAVARRVLLAVPPPDDPERGPMARSHCSASVRPTHGVSALRSETEQQHPFRNGEFGCDGVGGGCFGHVRPVRRAIIRTSSAQRLTIARSIYGRRWREWRRRRSPLLDFLCNSFSQFHSKVEYHRGRSD